MEEPRPKRRRTNSRKNLPSSEHYVGYVEDDETPEEIMAKFEAMERIQQQQKEHQQRQKQDQGESGQETSKSGERTEGATAAGGERTEGTAAGSSDDGQVEEGLDDETLREVFRQTSHFSIARAVENPSAFENFIGLLPDEYNEVMDEDYVSEDDVEDDAAFFTDERPPNKKPKATPSCSLDTKTSSLKASNGAGNPNHPHSQLHRPLHPENQPVNQQQQYVLAGAASENKLLKRRENSSKAFMVELMRIPGPPIPRQWGKVVRPPRNEAGWKDFGFGNVHEVVDSIDEGKVLEQAERHGNFDLVLLHPPWKIDGIDGKGTVTDKDIHKLNLHKICPHGLVMIWVEKEYIAKIALAMAEIDFVYVENLTWVHHLPNNRPLRGPSPYLSRSHKTMLIFRRDTQKYPAGKEMDIRHQRNPDVVVEVTKLAQDRRLKVPDDIYHTVETLLPEDPPSGKPAQFLELWAQPDLGTRPRWVRLTSRHQFLEDGPHHRSSCGSCEPPLGADPTFATRQS